MRAALMRAIYEPPFIGPCSVDRAFSTRITDAQLSKERSVGFSARSICRSIEKRAYVLAQNPRREFDERH